MGPTNVIRVLGDFSALKIKAAGHYELIIVTVFGIYKNAATAFPPGTRRPATTGTAAGANHLRHKRPAVACVAAILEQSCRRQSTLHDLVSGGLECTAFLIKAFEQPDPGFRVPGQSG